MKDSAQRLMKGRSEKVEKGIDRAVDAIAKYTDTLRERSVDLKARARSLDSARSEPSEGTGPPESSTPAEPLPLRGTLVPPEAAAEGAVVPPADPAL